MVEVWDSDKLGTDDYLGNVLVPVAAQREYKITGWFNLSRGAARPLSLVFRRPGSLVCLWLWLSRHSSLQAKSIAVREKSIWWVIARPRRQFDPLTHGLSFGLRRRLTSQILTASPKAVCACLRKTAAA